MQVSMSKLKSHPYSVATLHRGGGGRAGFEYVGGGLYLPATLLSKSAQPWAVQWD